MNFTPINHFSAVVYMTMQNKNTGYKQGHTESDDTTAVFPQILNK